MLHLQIEGGHRSHVVVSLSLELGRDFSDVSAKDPSVHDRPGDVVHLVFADVSPLGGEVCAEGSHGGEACVAVEATLAFFGLFTTPISPEPALGSLGS